MIDHLRNMAIFQTVAEQGSFRKAAERLRLSPSVVSHHVSKLETQVGLPLLYRSTRRISLTDAGSELLQAAQRMSAAAQVGLAELQRRVETPTGTLSVAAATQMAHAPFADNFTRFAAAYPGVHLSVHLSNDNVPLEGSGFDVAIRGWSRDLEDSSYKARRIGRLQTCLFAARSYVEARPSPRTLDDLEDWDWIRMQARPWGRLPGADAARSPRIVLTTDNYSLARRHVDAGLGFMLEAEALVAEEMARGALVRILPNAPLPAITVYAVTPANSPRDALANLFVDHIATHNGFPK